jgi:nucleoside-diphosphate-sugar epimerase
VWKVGGEKMKILITGGYGFIGSHVVDKFHGEGHEVVIIDNLSTGKKKNVKNQHKSYIVNISSKECDEIFIKEKFDIVVHLAAQVDVRTSIKDPLLDTESNILGLVNILNLSKKYGVSKLVFASSAAVYGDQNALPLNEGTICNPINPYGVNKLLGEYYCRQWTRLYDLDTLIFRFSNVYGPGQSELGESGVITTFIQKALRQQEITVYGDGTQTRDFIFVGDLTEAISKSVQQGLSGIYNLSTNTETSVNQIMDLLKSETKIPNIHNSNWRDGDIRRSRLDNSKLVRQLNWVSKYPIEKGLALTFQAFNKPK